MKSLHRYPERSKVYHEAMVEMFKNEEIELFNEAPKDFKDP